MTHLVGGHRFLPYERWCAAAVGRRQVAHRTNSVVRVERNYGPDGVALMAAGLCTMVPGEIAALIGLVMLISAGDQSSLATTSYVLLAVGLAVIALGGVRLVQAIPVGRAFRAGHPLEEPALV